MRALYYLRGVVPFVRPDVAHPLMADDGGQPVREGDVLHPELESVAEGFVNQCATLSIRLPGKG